MIRRLKTPGSSDGTTTFLNSTVAVQRRESADAVAVFPVSVQTSVAPPASKGVWNTPMRRPSSKVVRLAEVLGGSAAEPVLVADRNGDHEVVGVLVAPDGDIGLAVVHDHALEHRRKRQRVRDQGPLGVCS